MSPAYSRHLKMIGKDSPKPFEVDIGPLGKMASRGGRTRRAIVPPYMPEHLGKPLHPGGNSACFSIQIAHLMGAESIYLLGFTLQNGSRYFFGQRNPVLRRSAIYDHERACDWLSWYEATYPGKAKLLPGWSGPIYNVLQSVSQDEFERKSRARRDAEEQLVSSDRSGESVHPDGKQPEGDAGAPMRSSDEGEGWLC